MDFPQLTATVTVVPGDEFRLETVATYTNYAAPPGTLKICKIAGPGITVGTNFRLFAIGFDPGLQRAGGSSARRLLPDNRHVPG